MLISHKYKFIFLKARKVSGTSTEAYLERYCLSDEEEKIHENAHATEEIVSDYGIIGSRLSKPSKKWYNHKLPLDIKKDIGDDIWFSYKKICNIRNPFDIAVSMYFFKNTKNANFKPSINNFEFFLNDNIINLIDNKKFWRIENKFSHDFYIRQESLKEDLLNLVNELNLPLYTTEMPTYKIIPNRPHYSTLYNNNTIKIITDNFGDVLEHFKYKFEKK